MNEPMNESELISAVNQEISRGIGGLSNSDNTEISTALDYYYGRLPGITKSDAKDPRSSKYVSMDVMDGVEATVAEMMPSFDSEEIAYFPPSGKEDEQQSELETQLCNYLFFEEYDGWTLLQQAIKDALLNRNCTVKVFWDERAEVEYETIENADPMMLQQVMQPTAQNQRVEIVQEEIDEEEQIEQTEFTVKIKRTTLIGKPAIVGVPPEATIVNGDHNSPYLHSARFVAHEMIETVTSLIQQGFDPEIVEQLPDYGSKIDNISRARQGDDTDYQSAHMSTRQVQVYECYYLVDFDGDGIAERRKIVLGGNGTLLSNDPWDDVPLIGGVANMMPHKYQGISLTDRLRAIQDVKTPIIRSMVNGTALAANPRLGVLDGEANIDDLLASRTGGLVRVKRTDAVFDLAKAEVPASAYSLMTFMDNQRRERGGGAIGMAGQAGKAQGQGGDFALDRIMTSMELGNAVMAKSIGETLVRGIFIALHEIIRQNHPANLSAKIGGRWIDSTPSQWQKRANVKVMVGASHAERSRQAGAMEKVIGLQRELAQTGSVMFAEEKAYAAITDATQLAGIKSPDRYYVDPRSPEGQQANQAKQQQSSEKKQQDLQVQMQMVQAQMKLAQAEEMKGQAALQSQRVKAENDRLKNELEQMKALVDAADKSDQTEFDYAKLQQDGALKLTQLEQEYNTELNKQLVDNQGV